MATEESTSPTLNQFLVDEDGDTLLESTDPEDKMDLLLQKMDTIIGLLGSLKELKHLNRLSGLAELNARFVNNSNAGFRSTPMQTQERKENDSRPTEIFYKESVTGMSVKVWGRTYDLKDTIKAQGGTWNGNGTPKGWEVPKNNWEALKKELEDAGATVSEGN